MTLSRIRSQTMKPKPDVSIKSGITKMNWDQIKSNWVAVSERIKRTWGKLNEDDLAEIAGQRELLSGLLQQRYGYARVDAERKVDDFAQRLHP